jgi:hypothetical protein
VHPKKAPKEQKDTAKAVKTNLPKRDHSRGREGITCFKCGKVGRFRNSCTKPNMLCSNYKSTNHATFMCREEPEVKTVDKKEKQTESRKTKEDDKKAKNKKAKSEKHKARKRTPRRRRKESSSSSLSSSSESDSESEST